MFRKQEPVNKIIPFGSESAVTVFKVIQLERPNPREELTSIDLENHLAQAIWKFFDRLRTEAATRLQTNEADLLLADARVTGMKIDGHKIINPEGFTGRHLEFTLCLTLIKRDRLPAEGEKGTIFEEGSVRAHLMAKNAGLGEILYIESNDDSTRLFQVTPLLSSYLTEFNWGKNDVFKALTSELGTDNELGEALYLRYVGGTVSPRVMKRLDEIFYNTFGTFVNGLAMAIRNYDGNDKKVLKSKSISRKGSRNPATIYIRSFPLPETVWSKKFTIGDRRAKFLPAPDVDLNDFIDDRSNDINEQLNRLAKQRIKWLMAR
jgi:hypothetical protein